MHVHNLDNVPLIIIQKSGASYLQIYGRGLLKHAFRSQGLSAD